MKYCDSIHDDVEALASQKAFGELTPQERDVVLRTLGSADAYTNLRVMVTSVRSSLAADAPQIEPRVASRDALRRMVESRAAYSPRVLLADKCRAALRRRVPVAYSAVAVVAAVALTLFLHRPSTPEAPARIVYVERPVPGNTSLKHSVAALPVVQLAADSVVRKATVRLRKHSEGRSLAAVIRDTARQSVGALVRTVAASTMPGSSFNQYVGLGNLPQLQVQLRGRTFAEDSALARFRRPFSDDTL